MGFAGEPSAGNFETLQWFGFDDERNQWLRLDRHSASAYHWFAAVMQLVDRSGPIAAADLDRFLNGVHRVCDELMSVPASMPVRVETLTRAAELDAFCASVDVQIGLNVVAGEEAFPGTKLRAFAEAQGWILREDGAYHAEDADGNCVFTMTNLEPAVFVASELKDLQTRGITLLLDVPRTPLGPQTFDRMLASARKMAESLRGEVVDDNRTAFGESQAQLVRSQIEQFQQRMAESGIPAGGELARRLFRHDPGQSTTGRRRRCAGCSPATIMPTMCSTIPPSPMPSTIACFSSYGRSRRTFPKCGPQIRPPSASAAHRVPSYARCDTTCRCSRSTPRRTRASRGHGPSMRAFARRLGCRPRMPPSSTR